MPTYAQVSKDYADQIREAKQQVTLAKAEHGKTASVADDVFTAAVRRVLDDVDTLTTSEGALSEAQEDTILNGIDDNLGISRGTFKMLKKGSVSQSIKLDQQIKLLLTNIKYK